MATPVGRNFCIAPFTQITYSHSGSYSPCAEIGGRPWSSDQDIVKLWSGQEFENLRQDIKDNNRSKICNRCWDQESTGNQSLRRRLFTYSHLKENVIEFINGNFRDGPRQINLIVSNLCNLRCRICNAKSSVTFNTEGEYYRKKYNIDISNYTSSIKKQEYFTSDQIQEIFNLSQNLRRLEFYGGEPLLDKPTLTLLQKYVDSGQSKNITLFYNTNGVVPPTSYHYKLWEQFKSIEFNFSFDDINDRFTYQRHPANWNDALKNLQTIRNRNWTIPAQYQIICTVSVFNVYYLDEILKEFNDLNMPVFLNTIHGPDYYDIRFLPKEIKQQIYDHLDCKNPKISFVRNMLQEETNDQWTQFKFWTNAKDLYRGERFKDVFSEFYQILHNYDNNF